MKPESINSAGVPVGLGRLVRGLSAVFWGLPLALVACTKTALQDWLRPFGMLPAVAATGLLVYGLSQLSAFQTQERVWVRAVDRAIWTAWVNVGLSPFLFWWNRSPEIPYFAYTVLILMLSGLVFLLNLNTVLERLAAMLPDETLRGETAFFTALNRSLLLGLLALLLLYVAIGHWPQPSDTLLRMHFILEWVRHGVLIGFVLLPVALTMTLLWKTKEAILTSLFNARIEPGPTPGEGEPG